MSGLVDASGVSRNPGSDHRNEESETKQRPAHERFLLFFLVPSWSLSFLIHLLLILALALWFLSPPTESPISFQVGTSDSQLPEDINVDFSGMELEESTLEVEESTKLDDAPKLEELLPMQLEVPSDLPATPDMLQETPMGALAAASSPSGFGETGGRTGESRQKMLRENGGTAESEECVELALEWLAKHQLKDGSWNFDHTVGPGSRSRKNPGSYTQHSAAATAMALLPFLGSGFTHKEGKYKEVVLNGLRYLVEVRGINTPNGFSFFRSNNADDMYSHGLASIAICEAYAMTGDSWLQSAAQGTIKFIEYSQHSEGGWRYVPKQRGDTSVVGWQIMALKSGKMAGLEVSDEVVTQASRFLDLVSIDTGSHFGYMDKPAEVNGNHKTCTAIGLLCRMYLGWNREHPGLTNGVNFLAKQGPYLGSLDYPIGANMYYNYYATQVMLQYGGKPWQDWNPRMRDFLVKNMDREGNERGSWFFPGGDLGAQTGGRLYFTAMAAMTLEVYYRYMPLYKEKSVEDDFKLR